MSRSIAIFLLVAALLGVGAWSWTMRTELVALRAAAGESARDREARDALTRENRRLKDQISGLENQLQRSVRQAGNQAEAKAPQELTREAARGALAGVASRLLNTPAMRNMVAQRARSALETQFKAYFDQMGFTPEQRSEVLDLMVARQTGSLDTAMNLMSGQLTPEERADAIRQMQANTQAANEKLREYLGESGYASMQAYSREQSDRAQAVQLAAAFNQSGEPLSTEQAASLKSVIDEERRNFRFTQDLADPNADPVAAMNAQAVETYMRETGQLQSQIATRAANVLTPTQMEVFRRTQATQLQNARNGMDMARQMLGGQ